VADAARVLDAVKGYNPRDYFTAIPKALIPEQPYARVVLRPEDVESNRRPLAGLRIALVREFMVKHAPNDAAISDQMDGEIKAVLRDRLGAELVESVDPLYPDDPGVPNMKYTFQDAFREILAFNVPEYFFQTRGGELEFAVPGFDVRSLDYMVKLALGQAPLSDAVNLRRISNRLDNAGARQFSIAKYLRARGDARITDWASFVANAKWKHDELRAGAENAIGVHDIRATAGIDRIKMQTVVRQVILKVMNENRIDAFVNPENTLPPPRIGGPSEPTVKGRAQASCCAQFTALLGGPEIDVPAGYTRIIYEPRYVLSADKTRYRSVPGDVQSLLPYPMPISLMVWAGPGSDADVIKIASAYEAATHHRKPPEAFVPVPGEP
jgi:Asp-tRNA(Asn)/Glu-tRNA(Gln) amidotransferase A subunit family amidase